MSNFRRNVQFGDSGYPGGNPPGDPYNQSPPSYSPPMPGAPARGGGSPWKYFVIGCLAISLLLLIAVGGSCIYCSRSAGMGGIFKFARSEYMNDLSADHTGEQRERFGTLYDALLIEEMERLGFIQWSITYQAESEYFTEMTSDSTITVDESTKWCDMAYEALDRNDYFKE